MMRAGCCTRGVGSCVKPLKPAPKSSTTRSWVTLPATAKMFVQDLHVEARVFFGREGIHLPAHRVHLARDGLGRPRGGALEDQMLDQVRHPTAPLHLVTRTRLDPDSDGDRPNVGHPFCDD